MGGDGAGNRRSIRSDRSARGASRPERSHTFFHLCVFVVHTMDAMPGQCSYPVASSTVNKELHSRICPPAPHTPQNHRPGRRTRGGESWTLEAPFSYMLAGICFITTI